ncbi:hypothetical protein LCGC14_2775400, partial [marine sediment metagenome]
MSEQELSDVQRADLYLSRARRLQAVVDELRRESTRNLETAELAVGAGVALQAENARLQARVEERERCGDCADSPEDIRLPARYRCYFCDKQFC